MANGVKVECHVKICEKLGAAACNSGEAKEMALRPEDTLPQNQTLRVAA